MNLTPQQSEAVVRMVLAILASGRWPGPEDLRRCVELSDELLGLGLLLEAGAETVGTLLNVDQWRGRRSQPRHAERLSEGPSR